MKKSTTMITILFLSILSVDIYAVTIDEFMTYIADNYGHQVAGRPIVKDTKSFPQQDANYIKIKKDGLIIFKDTYISPNASEITFYGVTKAGEVLQFIDKRQTVTLINPLSNVPDTTGYWIQVKTVEGYVGWIYAGKNEEDIRTVLVPFNVNKISQTVAKKKVNQGDTIGIGRFFWGTIVIIGILFLIIKFVIKWTEKDKLTLQSFEESSGSYGSGGSGYYENKESYTASTSTDPTQGHTTTIPSISTGYGRPVIDTSRGEIREHSTLADALLLGSKQTHHVKINKLGGPDEIDEGTWGSHQVGTINKDLLTGTPESVTIFGETYKIKTLSRGKVLVDKDDNEVADFKVNY